MLSTEERSGLWFTVLGGAVLVVALLVGIGYFTDPAAPESATASDAPARARASSPLKPGFARGRVVDARTGYGLAAHSIDVRGLEGVSDHWLAEPDPEVPGSFEVRGLPAGRSCTLAIAVDGYVTTERAVSIGESRAVEFGDVALTPLVKLVGQVVDATGAGVGPGRVEARRLLGAEKVGEAGKGEKGETVASDLHGNFRFERLLPAEYVLHATTEEGDTSIAAQDAASPSASERAGVQVDATRGGERHGLEIAVFPSFTVRGVFKLPVGSAPLAGVAIPGARGKVAGDGRFEIAGVRAGPLRVAALIDDRRAVVFEVGAPFDGVELAVDPAQAQELAPEFTSEFASEFAKPSGSTPDSHSAPAKGDSRAMLVVRVVDEVGAPLRGARVEIRVARAEPESPVFASTWANRLGQCALRLEPGDYDVTVRHGDRVGRGLETLLQDVTRETTISATRPAAGPPSPANEKR